MKSLTDYHTSLLVAQGSVFTTLQRNDDDERFSTTFEYFHLVVVLCPIKSLGCSENNSVWASGRVRLQFDLIFVHQTH